MGVAPKRETEPSLNQPCLMVLTVLEMIQTHKTAVQMAAQVILNGNQGRVIWVQANYLYSTQLTVPGVHGVHGIPALQPVVVVIKGETDQSIRKL